jgi:hypothetical protein
MTLICISCGVSLLAGFYCTYNGLKYKDNLSVMLGVINFMILAANVTYVLNKYINI